MSAGVFAHWPNRITALRFVGALALFVIFAVWGQSDERQLEHERGTFQIAFWLFIATALSDVLDGWLARRGNQITTFGRIADPFVDKVLIVGAMIFLATLPWSRQYFPAWIVVVIVAREFLVTGIRGWAESQGHSFPADWFGKVKMFLQCIAVAIVIGLAAFQFSPDVMRFWSATGEGCVIATLVASVGSGLSYVFKVRKLLAQGAQ
jgi:CDP-diacylglycerol--glycerol-3-phosphate 3-phosphatidyltransferase